MKRITLHVEGRTELWTTIEHYELERAGLRRRFLAAFGAAAGRFAHDPNSFPIECHDVRRCRLTGFPYDVLFLDAPDVVWIIAIAHHHRRPRYWSKRLKS